MLGTVGAQPRRLLRTQTAGSVLQAVERCLTCGRDSTCFGRYLTLSMSWLCCDRLGGLLSRPHSHTCSTASSVTQNFKTLQAIPVRNPFKAC